MFHHLPRMMSSTFLRRKTNLRSAQIMMIWIPFTSTLSRPRSKSNRKRKRLNHPRRLLHLSPFKFNIGPGMGVNRPRPTSYSNPLKTTRRKITKPDWVLGIPRKLWLICTSWLISNLCPKGTARPNKVKSWKDILKDYLQARKNPPFGTLGRDNTLWPRLDFYSFSETVLDLV